jgi:hypothetical protein
MSATKNHSKVQDIIDELNNAANNGQAYVVIGGKAANVGEHARNWATIPECGQSTPCKS